MTLDGGLMRCGDMMRQPWIDLSGNPSIYGRNTRPVLVDCSDMAISQATVDP